MLGMTWWAEGPATLFVTSPLIGVYCSYQEFISILYFRQLSLSLCLSVFKLAKSAQLFLILLAWTGILGLPHSLTLKHTPQTKTCYVPSLTRLGSPYPFVLSHVLFTRNLACFLSLSQF